jgi:PTS system nitrogen regulatory IIA component
MFPAGLINTDRVRLGVDVASKKRLLESLAEPLAAAHPALTTTAVFDRLRERERLGSTGLGFGIALPHARVPEIEQAIGAFVQLSGGVDFDAPDDRPVDLAFGLLVPEGATDQHLLLLSQLAGLFKDEPLRQNLRAATTAESVLDRLLGTGV